MCSCLESGMYSDYSRLEQSNNPRDEAINLLTSVAHRFTLPFTRNPCVHKSRSATHTCKFCHVQISQATTAKFIISFMFVSRLARMQWIIITKVAFLPMEQAHGLSCFTNAHNWKIRGTLNFTFEWIYVVVPALCLECGYFQHKSTLVANKVENRTETGPCFALIFLQSAKHGYALIWLDLRRRSAASMEKPWQHKEGEPSFAMILSQSAETEMHVHFYSRWRSQSEEKVTWMGKPCTIISGGSVVELK